MAKGRVVASVSRAGARLTRARLILDTNVLLRRPDILSLGGANVRFLIPKPVLHQLSKIEGVEQFHDLVNLAVAQDKAAILSEPRRFPEGLPPHLQNSLDEDDQILIAAYEYFQRAPANANVKFVTEDRSLGFRARQLGLPVIGLSEVISQLGQDRPRNSAQAKELVDAAVTLTKTRRKYLVRGFVLGIAVTGALLLLWYCRDVISRTLPVWGITVGAAGTGFSLFWFRGRYRLSYGIVEFLFGLITATKVDPGVYDAAYFFRVVGGLYIVVRGLDNVEKGLQGTKMEPLWSRLFKKRA